MNAAAAALTRLVYDGTYETVHEDLRALLFDSIFDPQEGLTLAEAGRLAYERSRFVHSRLERPAEVVANPLRLFALAEWPSLLDVATFSVLMVHYNLCLGTVVERGSGQPEIKDYLDELDSLASFGPYMATELGYGNNVAAMRTEACYDNASETFVLNTPDRLAQKYMSYSGFPDIPKLAVVLARLKAGGTDHGVFPFLVRISDGNGLCEGVHSAPCPEKPVQGLDNGVTWFDHVRIPAANLLHGDMAEFGEDGTLHPAPGNRRKRLLKAMSRIQPGRLCVSSCAVGAGRASVYIALRYALQRLTNAPGRSDMPIIEYRSHQLALFTALAKVYAMTFLVNRAKREYLQHSDADSLSTLISITKALSTWEMSEVVATCRERCGAQGMFSVNRIADYVSLLQGLVTAEGDNQVLLATAAGQLLAHDAGESMPAGPPQSADILDVSFQRDAVHYRERGLHAVAREAMVGEGPYLDAWNDAVNTALAMARARGAWTALECYRSAIVEAGTGEARTALQLLASLYGLTEIQRDAGWYLARGVLTASQVEGIPGALDRLCERIRPDAAAMIEGFQLSPELLRAPIAADDYVSAFPSALPMPVA